VGQLRGRLTEERPIVRCLEETWALKVEREGKDCGSLAEAGLAYRGGAGNSESGEASSVSAVGDNGREAGLSGQDGGGGGEKIVRGPSLDPVPEAVHASERSVVRGEEVCTICEYGEEEATGDAVAEERSDAGP